MSLEGKNRKVFSYKNADRSNANFMYKIFDKAECYKSVFNNSNFDGASFRATKLKYCSFSNSTFIGSEFIGTNLRGSQFNGSRFENAIFNGVVLDKTSFKDCSFFHSIFVSVDIEKIGVIINDTCNIISSGDKRLEVPEELIKCAKELISNSTCRKSVIQLKEKKINVITLKMLLYDFTVDELIDRLPKTVVEAPKNCTVSYLRKMLKKMS